MGAKNRVIAGDYAGCVVVSGLGTVQIGIGLFKKNLVLDSTTVEGYELVTDEHRKSASSGVARGLIGGALLGPVGMLAGGLSAKNKGTYTVAIQFKDGKNSLLEVDDKIYKILVQRCF
ncbi:MAG: hypothetical protein JJT76_06960 [Clostridiaceae bacterium]|nr:hypothetical protein [Clostridiaceae bacterium]